MKKLVLILTFLSYGTAYGQLKPIQSLSWISNETQMMYFVGDEVLFEPYKEGDAFKYYFLKDTLVMVNKQLYDFDPNRVMHSRLYKFVMKRKGNEQLILTPVNDNAKKLDKIPHYTFTNRKSLVDRSLKFKTVHINSGGCQGCKLRTINIDDKGNYYLKKGAGLDTGYFRAKLNTKQLDTLNYLLQRSGIRKLQGWIRDRWHTGGGIQNVVIEYNGNILKMKNNIFPLVTSDLRKFVLSLLNKLTLVPDEGKYNHNFEDDATSEY